MRVVVPPAVPPTNTAGNKTEDIIMVTSFIGTFISGVPILNTLPEPAGLVYVLLIRTLFTGSPVKYNLADNEPATDAV